MLSIPSAFNTNSKFFILAYTFKKQEEQMLVLMPDEKSVAIEFWWAVRRVTMNSLAQK